MTLNLVDGSTFAQVGTTGDVYWGAGAGDYVVGTWEITAAVPEPSTLAGGLVGIALAGGAWMRRRRRLIALA